MRVLNEIYKSSHGVLTSGVYLILRKLCQITVMVKMCSGGFLCDMWSMWSGIHSYDQPRGLFLSYQQTDQV